MSQKAILRADTIPDVTKRDEWDDGWGESSDKSADRKSPNEKCTR